MKYYCYSIADWRKPPELMKNFCFLFLLLIFAYNGINAQDFSNRGKDFWLAYPAHVDGTTSRMALYISSTENTNGIVELDGRTIPFSVTANQATTVQISPAFYQVYNAQSDGTNVGKGIHVTSEKPIVLYSHILNAARSGSTLVFPTNVLGKEYVSLNYTQVPNQGRSQITVVATEDNTTVELNLKANSSGAPIRAAGQAYTVQLNKGDVYQVQSISDLTGSTIRSISTTGSTCKAIAVFTGSSWTGFCSPSVTSGNGGDNLFQQVFPSNAWGRNYITAPFARKQGDLYRIIVKDPTTVVTVNGAQLNPNTIKQNSYYDLTSFQANIITSDKPILVVQYMTSQSCDGGNIGDPEIITINPLEQTINNVTVISARRDLTPPPTNITVHYLNVIMKTANTGSLKIDGAAPSSNWVPIPNSAYSYLQQDVTNSTQTNPSHNIQADSGFIAIAYGMGNVESYGYNAGTNIVDLNPPVSIQNQFPSIASVNYSATCVGTSFSIKLALSYQPTKIVLDFTNSNQLSGPPTLTYNPSNFDSTYSSNGKTYYVYKIPQSYTFTAAGTYQVKFITTSLSPQSDGCSNTNEQEITDNIVVGEAPLAKFSIATIDSGCVAAPLQLTDQSTGSGRSIVAWNWDFGDGTSSSDKNPVKTFAAAGNYTVKLSAISDFGCVASENIAVNLSNKPLAKFTVPAVTCENSNIVFTDASTITAGTANHTIAQWKWNLDNGAGVVTQTTNAAQSHTYPTWGAKNVYLNVVSNTGCVSDTFRLPGGFSANPLPVVGFVLPEVCLNDATATFTDTSTIADGSEAGFSYLWKFDDGVSSVPADKRPVPLSTTTTNKTVSPSYKWFGNYTVSLEVTSSKGCATTEAKSFTVNGSTPIPKFEVANLLNGIPLCTNDSIKIINQSTVDFGDVTKLEVYWDFVGAPSSAITDQTPVMNKEYAIRYGIPTTATTPATKNYSVMIKAYSGQSSDCAKTLTKIIPVTYAPAVSFADIRDICYDATPRLITQGSYISAISATETYSGKGISAAGLLNPIATGVGNDTLKYLVQNNAGCKDSAYQPITVWPSPVAKWGIADPACEKNNLLFTDSSVANFSNITTWNWNFGDGQNSSRSSSAPFSHVFASAQSYTASLQVVTDSGCVSPVNQQIIRVNHLPKPAFSLPEICLPDGRGKFLNQSAITDGSEALFSYAWNFGDPNDPSSSTLKEPTHRYSTTGNKDVKLTITSKDGCVDSLTQTLTTIYPWPKANLIASRTEVCLGDNIQFTDQGNGITSAPVRWEWNLGGSDRSTLQNPAKTFTDSGSFTVNYYFYNSQGCVSDTVSQLITVHPYPVLELGPNLVVLEGGTKALKPEWVYGTNLNYQWTPATYLNSTTDSVPKTTPLGDITYRLNLTGIGGCTVTDTVFVKLLLAPVIPNAFSPNGDGINDRWRIQYLESYPGATVDVYDRYGGLVFSSIEYAVDWDGTRNGKALPIGTYYYVINPKNGRKIITGSVTIIR